MTASLALVFSGLYTLKNTHTSNPKTLLANFQPEKSINLFMTVPIFVWKVRRLGWGRGFDNSMWY